MTLQEVDAVMAAIGLLASVKPEAGSPIGRALAELMDALDQHDWQDAPVEEHDHGR